MTREEAAYWIDEVYGKANEQFDVLPVEMAIACDMAIEMLKEPERKKGKWLRPTGLSNPICSECHSCPNLLFGLTSKFCPNCGVEMEEEECQNEQ